MNRIDQRFAGLRATGTRAFIPYITAGDPTLARTAELIVELDRAGADVIELGIPFSDPIADGPVNQEAALRALKHGVSLHDVVAMVREVRGRTEAGLVLFTYYNPVLAYGLDAFARDASAAGVDGVLCVDLPPEESEEYKKLLDAHGIATVYLLAPTSTDERIALVARQSSGFIYYVSRTGVTGVRTEVERTVHSMVDAIRRHTDKPIAVGFGVSTPEQVREIAGYADGVIVGSAIVRKIQELAGRPREELVAAVGDFIAQLAAGTRLNPDGPGA